MIKTTRDILEKFAPQLVALDEAEMQNKEKTYRDIDCPLCNIGTIGQENQLRALLDAYAQALVKLQEQDWQPIETAPQDGTLVDLRNDLNDRITDCLFEETINMWMRQIRYSASDGRLYTVNSIMPVINPTHWRPIPAPPSQKEA